VSILRYARPLVVTVVLSLALILLAGVGTALAGRMDVVVWGQKDARWSGLHLGGSRLTMGNSGCAVTSSAMIANYFESTKDPGQLCLALGAKGGLDSSGSLSFEKVPAAAGGNITSVGWYPTDLSRINRELDAGNLVIAEVWLLKTINHFVVITGHDGATYYINDPWYGDKSTINARYGNPATAIRSTIVFRGHHVSGPTLGLGAPVSYSRDPVRVGDSVSVSFTVKNMGGSPGTWSPVTLTLKDPFGSISNVTAADSLHLAPGESRSLQVSWRPNWTGVWTSWVTGRRGAVGDRASSDGSVTVSPSQPPAPPFFKRIQGADRYQTAIALSKAGFPTGAPAVVLVTGADYPDALCAAPLAKAYGAPILLVPPGGVTDALGSELQRLAPSQILSVGLAPVIRSQVLARLPSAVLISIVGQDRYQTAAFVADRVRAKLGPVGKVVVAPGDSFADGLAVAPLAASQGWPVLLTPRGGAPPQTTTDEISKLGADSALVVGTYARANVAHVDRLVGADRYATCALIAQYAAGHGASFTHAALVTGENFPDALVAGAYLSKDAGILLLTRGDDVPSAISALLSANSGTIHDLDLIALPGLAARVGG